MTDPNKQPTKPDARQMVSVQFARGSRIKPGTARHPWHWCILIQLGHLYHISMSFDTIEEAIANFTKEGAEAIRMAEKQMAQAYSPRPGEEPYDINVINP